MFEKYKQFIGQYISINFIEWNLFQSKLKIVHYKKGDIIHPIGETCDALLFINNGLAHSFVIGEDGKDYTWAIYFNDTHSQMTNLFAVDYDSFIHQNPSRLEIEALEDCEMVLVSYKDVQFIYNKLKRGEQFGRLMSQEAYSYLHNMLIDRQIKSATERFHDFIQQTPYLLDKVPQYHIATFLGITPQHLSKLKKQYKN